jgi:hypothetical protein
VFVNFKIILFLLPLFCFSQNQIKIKVLDDNLNPISRALIVISENDRQIAFGTTNEEGTFEKSLENGTYEVKASKLGYVAFIQNVVIDGNRTVEFILENEVNKLETVIIKSRPKIMKIKGDTISYNIKVIADGTENKVDDLIRKLPGLNVDEAGKVSYKGQEIDKVLIDGNEFFNNKHQMATQNIDANMVEGIDLLLNHSGFSQAAGGEKSIALNLKMKDGFKNKWIGEVDFGAGTKDAFKLHNNLFKFFKNGNIAIIMDYNTIAKTPISFADYSEMQNVSTVSFEEQNATQVEMPSFLNPSTFFTEKVNRFVGVHYTSKISERAKITITNIFNSATIVESQFKNQTNIGENAGVRSFSDVKNADYLLNNTSFKLEFNKSKKTYFSYFAGFTPNFDDENNDIVSQNLTVESDRLQNNSSFSQQFQAITKLFEKVNYKFYFKHRYQFNDQSLDLNSLSPLFETNSNQINQDLVSKNNFISLVNEFSVVQKKNLFSLKLNLLSANSAFNSSISQNQDFTNNLNFDRNTILANPSWLRTWSSKLQSTIGAKMSLTQIDFTSNADTFFRFEPVVNLAYNLGILNKLSFNYSLSHELPNVSQLQENSTAVNFQTLFRGSLVSFNQVLPRNEFSLDYLKINTRTQSVLFSKISYSTTQNAIATNNSYQANYAENNFITTDRSALLNAIAYYDLKFTKLPFSIKNTAAYFDTDGFSQFEGIENNLQTKIFSGKSQVTSNFKNSNLQFDLGFDFRQTQFSQSINSFSNKTVNSQTSLNLRGKFRTLVKWNVEVKRDYQNSDFSSNKIDFLNANFQYNLSKKIKFNINGFNLLNLDRSQIITTNINEAFFTETITRIMPGYILAGFAFSY